MNIKVKIDKKNFIDNIYYAGILLITFIRLIQDSTFFNLSEYVVTGIKVAAAACFFIKIITRKYTKKECIIDGILVAFAVMCVLITKIEMVLLTLMILIGIKDIDIKKVVKIVFYVSVVVIAIHSVSYLYAYIFHKETINVLLTKDFQVRHYVYFSHPNMFAGIVFGMVLEWNYLYGRSMKKIYKYIIIMIVATIVYIITISRTTLILFVILALGLFLVDLNKKIINKLISVTSKYIFAIISIIVVIFLMFYKTDNNNKYVQKIDEALSGRITLGLYARDKYGNSIIPQYIDFKEKIKSRYAQKLVIDNFYIRYSLSYGILSLVIISVTVWNASRKSNTFEQLYLIIFAIWGITEGVIFDIAICIILLLMADKLLNDGVKAIGEGEKKEEKDD